MNIFHYLEHEGKEPFEARPFNELDSLCLSLFSYLPLSDKLPEGFSHARSLQELCGLYLIYREECEAAYAERFSRGNTRLFRLMARSERFASLSVTGFTSVHDEAHEMQFSALTVSSPEFHFLSFRGTDATLIGWKEDFNMSFLSATPSQLAAKEYLETALSVLPRRPMMLGGHSKGGNLAMFAASAVLEERDFDLRAVYAHDAPGFRDAFLQTDGYRVMLRHCCAFIPQTSVVGMLLGGTEEAQVIHSTSFGLFQHDPYSWQIEGERFRYEEGLDASGRLIDRALTLWLSEMDAERREEFVDALYELVLSTEAQSVMDLSRKMLSGVLKVLKKHKSMDETTRLMLRTTTERLFQLAWESVQEESGLREKGEALRSKEAQLRRALSEAYTPAKEKLLSLFEEKRSEKDEKHKK